MQGDDSMNAAREAEHFAFLCEQAIKYKEKYGHLIPQAIYERIRQEDTALTDQDINYIVWRITGVYQSNH